VDDPETAQPLAPNRLGVHHFAFQVDSLEALKDAYFTLQDHGVEVVRVIDHVSQKSIYFHDPDGNRLEIYYELPNALEMFRQGRADRDEPFVLLRTAIAPPVWRGWLCCCEARTLRLHSLRMYCAWY
jgi:catechol-2,3-dioxygenase